jgi:hypothetical protein
VPDVKPTDEKKKLLEAEVERLRAELGVLEQQWKKRYWLALFGLFAIPGMYFFGLPALALGILGTPALVATQSYLLAVRRAECEQLIEESRRALLRLARAADPAGAARPPKPA